MRRAGLAAVDGPVGEIGVVVVDCALARDGGAAQIGVRAGRGRVDVEGGAAADRQATVAFASHVDGGSG